MLPNEAPYRIQSASAETIILRQFDSWFYPELRFTLRRVHVNMHARFLTGEEKESKWTTTKYCRACASSYREKSRSMKFCDLTPLSRMHARDPHDAAAPSVRMIEP